MKEIEFIKEIYEINHNLVTRYKSVLYKAVKTLDYTNIEEMERTFTLAKTIEETTKSIEKMREKIQILEEEEKINEV